MPCHGSILFASDGPTWRLVPADAAGDAPHTIDIDSRAAGDDRTGVEITPAASTSAPFAAAELAAALVAALRAQGAAAQPILLALPSSWCLSAAIPLDGLPRRGADHATRLYRLEEHLPLAAEDVVADFVAGRGGGRDTALGVAAPLERLAPLVEALEREGVTVQHVAPAAILALQDWVETHPRGRTAGAAPSTSRDGGGGGRGEEKIAADAGGHAGSGSDAVDVVVWLSEGTADLFVLDDGRPMEWQLLPLEAQTDDLVLALRMESLRRGAPLHVVCCGDAAPTVALAQVLRAPPELEVVEVREEPMTAAAARTAALILRGRVRPWIELRRDALAPADPYRQVRRPLTAAGVLAAVFLLALCGAALWRAQQYEALAADLAREQEAVFRQALPGQPVPLGVRARLESEARRVRGLHGADGSLDALRQPPSSLAMLHDVLARLPSPQAMRYRILELQLDEGRVFISGHARSHGDADAIAAALRRDGRLHVDPPRTENLAEQGVDFTISGRALSPEVGPRAAVAGLATESTVGG